VCTPRAPVSTILSSAAQSYDFRLSLPGLTIMGQLRVEVDVKRSVEGRHSATPSMRMRQIRYEPLMNEL